jgi:hypothetical protein
VALECQHADLKCVAERGAPARWERLETPFGQVNRGGGRQQQLGPRAPEGDQADPVALLVGVQQQ